MRRANILILNGDPAGRGALREAVGALGHAIIGEAESGALGLSLARTLRPDLVLLEMRLPFLSGLEVAKVLVDEQIAPCLVFSDNTQPAEEYLGRLETSGVMGFLSHPLRASDLGAGVEIAISRWRKLMELQAEVKSLSERMEARKLVGRAKAILMERYSLMEREAFRRIQAQSVALGRPVHEIARAIITASEIPT